MRKSLIVMLLCAPFLIGCQSAPSNSAHPSYTPERSSLDRSGRPQSSSSAPFDYYLLTLSWSPEYCYSHRSDIQCMNHSTFVLHGLWPERTDGTFPENCSNVPGPAGPSQYQDIYPDVGLLRHEWKTHGTCSGLDPDTFFNDARSAFNSIKLPTELTQLKAQTSMPPAQILALFARSNPSISLQDMELSCGNNFLTAVQVCLAKQTLTPTSCGSLKSCRANTVKVPNP